MKYEPKSTDHLDRLMKSRRTIQQKEEKPVFKMRMFSDVGSKVVVGIKNFKTYGDKNHKKTESSPGGLVEESQLDNMIEKIENELKELQTKGNNDNENENEC